MCFQKVSVPQRLDLKVQCSIKTTFILGFSFIWFWLIFNISEMFSFYFTVCGCVPRSNCLPYVPLHSSLVTCSKDTNRLLFFEVWQWRKIDTSSNSYSKCVPLGRPGETVMAIANLKLLALLTPKLSRIICWVSFHGFCKSCLFSPRPLPHIKDA